MIRKTTIGQWMKKNVITIQSGASLEDAARLMVEKKIGSLPILDESRQLIGLLSINKIIAVLLPDFVSLLENIDFVKDFGAFKIVSPEDFEQVSHLTINEIMETPVAVEEDCSLVRALSIMKKHDLRDLLVVRNGQLAGIASWVDVGRAFLSAALGV
ncbi:MAG: CBS domain-containing protein [Chloroflexi bacterium]|nr:CBS domain-containing protein [Chloroflexota bacterium]